MNNSKDCKHLDIVTKIHRHNAGRIPQERFFVARCRSCNTVLAMAHAPFLDQKFQVIFRDLQEIKGQLATLITTIKELNK